MSDKNEYFFVDLKGMPILRETVARNNGTKSVVGAANEADLDDRQRQGLYPGLRRPIGHDGSTMEADGEYHVGDDDQEMTAAPVVLPGSQPGTAPLQPQLPYHLSAEYRHLEKRYGDRRPQGKPDINDDEDEAMMGAAMKKANEAKASVQAAEKPSFRFTFGADLGARLSNSSESLATPWEPVTKNRK